MKLEPITLTGELVRLEPLERRHAADLFAISQDPRIWTYYNTDLYASPEHTERWLNRFLEKRANGEVLPFVIVQLAT